MITMHTVTMFQRKNPFLGGFEIYMHTFNTTYYSLILDENYLKLKGCDHYAGSSL